MHKLVLLWKVSAKSPRQERTFFKLIGLKHHSMCLEEKSSGLVVMLASRLVLCIFLLAILEVIKLSAVATFH